MATAAYNAGPNRAKKWQAAVPLEGAIYAENIPFTETRLYVQRVLANAHLYAKQLGLKPMPLKTRLGTIPSNMGQMSVSTDTTDDKSPELTNQ
jgi:soluble lytic murein transglycosylase